MSKVRIIANPISGRGKSRAMAEELAAEVASCGLDVDTVFTQAKGEATEAAAATDENFAAVCAVGGDGTEGF